MLAGGPSWGTVVRTFQPTVQLKMYAKAGVFRPGLVQPGTIRWRRSPLRLPR